MSGFHKWNNWSGEKPISRLGLIATWACIALLVEDLEWLLRFLQDHLRWV